MTDPDPRALDQVDEMGRAAGVSTMEHFATVPAFESVDRGSSRGSWLFAAAALVLVLALAAAAFAVLGNGDDDVPVVTDDGSGPALEPLAPTYVPEGYELSVVEPPGSSATIDSEDPVGLVRSGVDDPFAHELVIMHRQLGTGSPNVPDMPNDRGEVVDLGRVDGLLVEAAPDGRGHTSLGWVDTDTFTALMSYNADPDLLVDLARALVVAGADDDAALVGWSTVPLTVPGSGAIIYRDSGGQQLVIHLQPEHDARRFLHGWTQVRCEQPALGCPRATTVRGVSGDLVGDEGTDDRSIAWRDPSGWWVMLESTLPEDELLRIAESLEPTTWDELESLATGVPEPDDGTEFEEPGGEAVADSRVQRLIDSPDFQVRPVLDQRQLDPGEPGWPSRMLGLEADRPALLLGEDELLLYELGESVLDGTGLSGATVGRDEINGGWMVWLELEEVAHEAFEALAETCFGQGPECPTGQIAIVWEGRVVAAPAVQVPGGFDAAITLGPFDSLDLFLGDFHG